jgi:hypothetical protein
MAKTEKVFTAAQVKRLIAKERKLWEAERTDRLMATESMIATAKAHGQLLTQSDRNQARRQSQCNHLKGGLITMSDGRRIFPVKGGRNTVRSHQAPNDTRRYLGPLSPLW